VEIILTIFVAGLSLPVPPGTVKVTHILVCCHKTKTQFKIF